ncbi:pitrilysin family protein [Sphingomonas sp. 2R-10]|uniref:M16 family metallopeptidase n=1 Tax=Sphingomonas sp. 2R-10 TaxID=3045148 RepID=UPI0013DDC16E|nr:pitrilysin family protein [Sphingomonas sp. 2R-10]MDJ0276424.1 pitrilysin family protein [Sphingomonas sp. 2R-10]
MTLSITSTVTALFAGAALVLPVPGAARTMTPPAPSPSTRVAPAPPASIRLDYQRFTLPNGLTVLVHTDHSVPNVYLGIWYKTGSKDEPVGRSGFAHLFEHLMFQQTANRKGEFLTIMDQAGASDMNGSTTTDYTSYYEIVPTNALDMALWMESDRMGYLGGGITQEVLDEQRRVVKNEKRMRESAAAEEVQRRFMAAYYPPNHPYAHTTIGSMEDLDAASLDDVRQWFDEHYGAGNAVLVLSGDIDLATAKEKVSKYFGALRSGKAFSRPDQWVPALGATRRDLVYLDGAAPQLTRTWPVSNDDPHGNTLLLLGARTMTSVRNAPFTDYLVNQAKVATAVEADFSSDQLESRFSVAMQLRPGVTPQAASAALDVALRRFFKTGPTPAGLTSIITGTDTAILRAMDSSASLGQFLIEGEVMHEDPGFFLKQRDWALAATPAEVAAVAGRSLGAGRPYYEQVILPQPEAATRVADVDRSRIPPPGPLKTTVTMPQITQMTLSNGMKLVVAERHNLPIVDMSMQFDTGTLAERSYAPGAAAAAFQLLPAGTATQDAERLAERSSLLDVPLSPSVDAQGGAFRWSAGTARIEESFALAADVLRHPAYPAAAVAAAAASTAQRLQEEPDPEARAERLFANAVWGNDDPRGKLERPEAYRGLTRAAVVRFHDGEIGPSNATLLMVGDVTPARAKVLAERYFGSWRPNMPAAAATLPPARAQRSRIILVDAPGAAQSSITVGNVAPAFGTASDPAEQVASAVLANGSSGRLNMNLRETKGWTYGFGGGIDDAATGDRLFTVGGAIETAHTAEAMAEIRREMTALLTDRPIIAPELEGVQSTVIRSIAQRVAGAGRMLDTLNAARRYRMAYDSVTSAADRASAVSLDAARAAAGRIVKPDQLTWVVVGDLKTIEPEIRALDMAPVEVWDASGKKLR